MLSLFVIIYLCKADIEVQCQGLYDRKYKELYDDGNAGATTSKKLWLDSRARNECAVSTDDQIKVQTICNCCEDYSTWKKMHPSDAKILQEIADMPIYYKVCDERVNIHDTTYQGTIRALHMAPKGECTGIASSTGPHPFTCDACEALQHGKSSQLLHKLWRATKLKHPRSEQNRAGNSGISHKFCSKKHLASALQKRKITYDLQSKKVISLSKANEKLLSDSWKNNTTARPFIEQLLKLLEENKLSSFDFGFLNNWLGKKIKGRFYHASEQAKHLAILLSNKLGEKMYTSIAPIMGLPIARQAQRLRAKERSNSVYMPGLNDWAFKLAAESQRPFHNSMDGTRVVRAIELYENEYLVGEYFPPDCRLFPTREELTKAESHKQIQDYVLSVRHNHRYAAEAYSFDLVDTTGKLPEILTGTIPEATSGVTASHIYSMMLNVEQKAAKYNLSLVGHCTDSASNSLNALLKLATPSQYLVDCGVSFLGLKIKSFYLFAPFIRKEYPSIAYSCWDHSARTVIRNLMNRDTIITAEVHDKHSDKLKAIECRTIASIQDLCYLKQVYPSSHIKHGDFSPYIYQNCDATSRLLTQTTIEELQFHVPGSKGTQLYLQAAVWTHAPYRNDKFGPPPSIAKSLWAGIMTWRRWRQYIIITPGLSLSENFISRPHYLTEELLVHAGINHLLCLHLCFPSCDLSEYNLRHTGNRGIEAIHGMFRGGTSSLPMTSPNLSFREFLTRMNSAQQMKRAEHSLNQIDGSSFVASKKKRKTFAQCSNEGGNTEIYELPETYDAFLSDLETACHQGDRDSKAAIERLAPHISKTLKEATLPGEAKGQQWECPSVPLDNVPSCINIVSSLKDTKQLDETFIESIITKELGPMSSARIPASNEMAQASPQSSDYQQALANLLLDISPVSSESTGISPDTTSSCATVNSGKIVCDGKPLSVTSLLRGLQPHREKPSKDRGKRFAAGELSGNLPLHIDGNEVEVLQYWTLFPSSQALKTAQIFLLGQISLILTNGKPCHNAENNPSTEVVLTLYDYDEVTSEYHVAGKTAILTASSVLHVNVSSSIIINGSAIKLPIEDLEQLHEYVPFSHNININDRLKRFAPTKEFEPLRVTDDDDRYIVEKIIKKQFNTRLGQYEFFVKWKGYSERHNTWELITNIPEDTLTDFERASSVTSTVPYREGLRDRQTIKRPYDPNFISNN